MLPDSFSNITSVRLGRHIKVKQQIADLKKEELFLIPLILERLINK